MVSSALASRTLTPSGRLWRPKRSCGRILSNHAVLTQTYSSKTKKPRYREALLVLVGPGGFEPPTSTMSRPIGRTKTRVDSSKLVVSDFGINRSHGTNWIGGAQPAGVGRPKLKSTSLMPLTRGESTTVHEADVVIGWEIFGGRALREGNCKLTWIAGHNGGRAAV